MASNNQSTTSPERRGLSVESARKILAEGKIARGNQTIYVMTNTLSELPPLKNEELSGKDFVVTHLSGEVTTEYGEAWIFEIGRNPNDPTLATHSWLVGKPLGNKNDSVIGKNLKRHFDRNGYDALPLWVHLEYHDNGRGNAYYALEAPHVLVDRAQGDTPAPTPPDSIGDLPF